MEPQLDVAVWVALWLIYSSEKNILWKLVSAALPSVEFCREQNKYINPGYFNRYVIIQSGASRAHLLTGEQHLAEEHEWKLLCRLLMRKGVTTELLCYSPRKSFLHLSHLKWLVFLRGCLVFLHKSLWYFAVSTHKIIKCYWG